MSIEHSSCPPKIAILGAGLMGRLLALSLIKESNTVELFDQDDAISGMQSAAYLAAAMLAPLSESAEASREVMLLGEQSLARWPDLLSKLEHPVFFQQAGSLIVAFEQDEALLKHFQQRLKGHNFEDVSTQKIHELEPELNPRLKKGIFLPQEGQLDNRALLKELATTLNAYASTHSNFIWHQQAFITRAGETFLKNGQPLDLSKFDWIIDCRGFGQKKEQNQEVYSKSSGKNLNKIPALRGVRGEVLRLKAPGVQLNRPVRLMHPRYPIYITPKEQGVFVVGATQIETEDDRQPTVRSTLELLSACFSVHPGFAEAEILEIAAGIRPAYMDNEPKIVVQKNIININGLFRHGFLLAPAMVDACLGIIDTKHQLAQHSKYQERLQTVLNIMPALVHPNLHQR